MRFHKTDVLAVNAHEKKVACLMNCNSKKPLKLFWPCTVLCGTDSGT